MDNDGVGLYKIQAMLNHDCNPNAQVKFCDDSDRLSIQLLAPVEKDQEICIR